MNNNRISEHYVLDGVTGTDARGAPRYAEAVDAGGQGPFMDVVADDFVVDDGDDLVGPGEVSNTSGNGSAPPAFSQAEPLVQGLGPATGARQQPRYGQPYRQGRGVMAGMNGMGAAPTAGSAPPKMQVQQPGGAPPPPTPRTVQQPGSMLQPGGTPTGPPQFNPGGDASVTVYQPTRFNWTPWVYGAIGVGALMGGVMAYRRYWK